jgi:bifunctional non-homologous end joining protein LigD
MPLKPYRKKRNLETSKEPYGKQSTRKQKNELTFVVQKHAARRLNYDFRLELNKVLKSWAVPKGPSMDPKNKRLAIQVEDHPLEYGKFEGIIPQGEYGAGKVEIWDKGTYTPADPKKSIKRGLEKGEILITLSGKKLKGDFALVRIKKNPKNNQWLLIKSKDDHSAAENSEPPKTSHRKRKDKMPHHLRPMLATLVEDPFDDSDWIFEVKWDGYRAITEINGKNIDIYSRNLKSFKSQFPSIRHAMESIHENVILDGEIVALDKKGRPSFQLLQQYLKTGKGDIVYYIFDLLYLDDQDLRQTPLLERKKLLKEFLAGVNQPELVYCDHIASDGKAFYKEAKKLGLEGIMGKKKDSVYSSIRSHDWLKIKMHNSQEAIIVGYTEPRGERKILGSLLLGMYQGKELVFIGHVGTGFSEQTLKEIQKKLQPLIVKKCPLKNKPVTNTPAVWVKPTIVCEVNFAEWTDDKKLRQPSFKGIRKDKSAKEVVMEKPKSKKENEDFLSNKDKIFWKKEKITKGDLLEYYASISRYIIPYLKNYPIVMHRYPDGPNGKEFYQKDAPDFIPKWIKTTSVKHSEKTIDYILINDKKTLLYVVNLGSIELHPFLSRVAKLDKPDYLVLDLDPEGIAFSQVVKVALEIHAILDEINVPNFCKTSGKSGLHIYVPLGAKYSYEQSQNFAELIARVVSQKLPKITSLVRNPKKRQKKVYIDYLQNSRTKTVTSPYSVRPTPQATVSTPLEWSEVNAKLDPKKFTIKTTALRLKNMGDPFKSLNKRKANLKSALAKIGKLTALFSTQRHKGAKNAKK